MNKTLTNKNGTISMNGAPDSKYYSLQVIKNSGRLTLSEFRKKYYKAGPVRDTRDLLLQYFVLRVAQKRGYAAQ